MAHYHAIARIADASVDHLMGTLERDILSKADVEGATLTIRVGFHVLPNGNMFSADLENAFYTVSRLSFLAELYIYPALHPIILVASIIY
jgi:hypothetical protein